MRSPLPDSKPRFVAVSAAAALISLSVLIAAFLYSGGDRSLLCSLSSPSLEAVTRSTTTTQSLTSAILQYATSPVTPQQSRSEISVSYRVLRARSPCNFLVFGLGRDSLMWHSFNLIGSTVFLEEDPKWFQSVLKDNPMLKAFNVKYRTRLIEADELIKSWREEKDCLPGENKGWLKGNVRCRLALAELPEVVYEKEWDVIMIDAPKGYFNEAPGRMGAIYSAAVMARNRKGAGPTDVFLHDVDRRVEKMFAMEFLCKKNLVEGVGRLWHFRIPAVKGNESSSSGEFC